MEPITLTNWQRVKMWLHCIAVVVFCVMPLIGSATGVLVNLAAFVLGGLAMCVAIIHAGLFDREIGMLLGRK